MNGAPMKKVPVNSSKDVIKTNMELAIKPGVARGRVMRKKTRSRDAPRFLAASSKVTGIDLNAAVVIQTE